MGVPTLYRVENLERQAQKPVRVLLPLRKIQPLIIRLTAIRYRGRLPGDLKIDE